jgi:hypothetical protein
VTRRRPAAAARSGSMSAALGTLISRPPSRSRGTEAKPTAPPTRSRTTPAPATAGRPEPVLAYRQHQLVPGHAVVTGPGSDTASGAGASGATAAGCLRSRCSLRSTGSAAK